MDSDFQGVCFGTSEENIKQHLGSDTSNIHILQLLAGTSSSATIPVKSLLHTRTDEILDGDTENYISSTFTTGSITTSNITTGILTASTLTTTNATISTLAGTDATIGTLTVTGTTSLSGNVNATGQTITASIFKGDLDGNLKTARTISLSGDISGHVAFDASKDVTINTEIGEGKVGTVELATNAVTSDKVAEGAITTKKIGFGVTMTLTVSDTTLVLSIPKLENN